MCSLTTCLYACGHEKNNYWTYCAIVPTQKKIPKYAQCKCCQGEQGVREELEEVLKKKCEECRKAEKVEKGGWIQRLRSKSRGVAEK